MLAVGDLVRVRNLRHQDPIFPWLKNGMGGEIIAAAMLRTDHGVMPFYRVRIGERYTAGADCYFGLVLPAAGGAEPVEWDWRDLQLGVFP